MQEEHLEGLGNEELLQAIWRINSLQRSLSIMALTWASCLHDAAAAAFPGKPRQGLAAAVYSRPSSVLGGTLSQVGSCFTKRRLACTLEEMPHLVYYIWHETSCMKMPDWACLS